VVPSILLTLAESYLLWKTAVAAGTQENPALSLGSPDSSSEHVQPSSDFSTRTQA
jgi:hypothetical protein